MANDAATQYRLARKRGQKQYHDDLQKGVSPYPKVLDELLLGKSMAGRVEVGTFDIPIRRIVGTVSAGRRTAFSSDFMPLLEPDTEFAMKWTTLCAAHLDKGIVDPIRCYEYMGDFYVAEGNKRVSVLRYYDATTVSASVLRVVPVWNEDPQTRLYYEFLGYFRITKLYPIRFEREGQYHAFLTATGFPVDAPWTDDQRKAVVHLYQRFTDMMQTMPHPQGVTTGDLFLAFVKTYPIDTVRTMSNDAMRTAIAAVATEADASVSVATESVPVQKSVLTRLVDAVLLPDHLNAAFVHALSPQSSDWVAAHEKGRLDAEAALMGKATTKAYVVSPDADADTQFEQAIAEGAQVIFATTPSLIHACRRAAAAHPQVKILNCSVIMPYPGVRTYYSRIYEAKFVSGAIAGAMTRTGTLGYIASSPIFGVPAGINAFALGARLTNPRARVKLHWSCEETDPLAAVLKDGADVISNRDLPMEGRPQENWGLLYLENGGLTPLAAPFWNWGEFYTRLMNEILEGRWADNAFGGSGQAVNYWWGMQSGVVDLVMQPALPEGVRTLALLLKNELSGESLLPFYRTIRSQDGVLRSDGTRLFSPREILEMDWLCDTVDGDIPSFDRLLPMAKNLVRLEGVYRDTLPPEEDT